MRDVVGLWPRAKEILLPYEGMASQLYVLDLPLAVLPSAVEQLHDATASPEVITLDGYSGEPLPFSPDIKAKMLASVGASTLHVLEGRWTSGPPLQTWIMIDVVDRTFDLEFVFWANLVFPSPADDSACAAAFAELVAFAEGFRALNPASECVLSASEVGDPRDDRTEAWTLVW